MYFPAMVVAIELTSSQTLCAPIGVFAIDNVGRRKLMMIGATGMRICMAVISGCSSQTTGKSVLGAATAFIYLFSPFFVTGFLGLAFLYSSEISPLSVRTPVTALSTCTAWAFNFAVAEITPVGFATLGYRYFVIFAVINLCLVLPSKCSFLAVSLLKR